MTEGFLWLLGVLGIGGIAALIFFRPFLVAFLKTKPGQIIAGIALAALGAFGIYSRGQATGERKAEQRQKEQTKKEVKQSAKQAKRVKELPPDKLDEELAKWDRE